MSRKFTVLLTIFSIALCLYHAMGLDHDHIVLYLFSIPAWILPVFVDLEQINAYFFYFLTIASWFGVGWGLDYLAAKYRNRSTTR
ncbi:hypothetical protein [Marinicrinis lubricantis]|uniref:Uncharacterized protein n=1 Tax=Marinicrinis lubricantis TaxID=2086470 RepID=A0ABW1IUF0_9BACL